jgi:hypothetical protein
MFLWQKINNSYSNYFLFLEMYNCGFLKLRPVTTTPHVHLQELASHSPLGLNLTEDTALVCPASVNFNV